MGRNSVSPAVELDLPARDDNGGGDVGLRSNYDRSLSLFKRTHPHTSDRSKLSDRHLPGGRYRSRRKTFQFKGNSVIYSVIMLAVFGFALASMVLQSSITSVFRQGGGGGSISGHGLRRGTSLRFVAPKRFLEDGRLDLLRMENRTGVRPPRLAVVLQNMKKSPQSLMLFTLMKSLRQIGYILKIYALNDGEARTIWEETGQTEILSIDRYHRLDWSLFEGVIVDSLEAKEVLPSLMQEPFCSVPLVWIIQEDRLAKRIPHYNSMGWNPLISHWRYAFQRADVVVFPDFLLPMLYSPLDSGNFFVIPGSPIDVWAAESYVKSHPISNLRASDGYSADDVLVLVLGHSIFYNEESQDYAVAILTIGPLLMKYAKGKDTSGSFRFIFLCGNATNSYSEALEGVATHLRLTPGSLRHYNMDQDVNGIMLMADIVLYQSSQDEQAFPSLLLRAMSFGIPVVVPDLPVTRQYIVDSVHGMVFSGHNPDELLRVFSLLITDEWKLSKFAVAIGSAGKLLARNLLASESITGYAKLLENVLSFPSETLLPAPIEQIQQDSWEWSSFSQVMEQTTSDEKSKEAEESSVVFSLETYFSHFASSGNTSGSVDAIDIVEQDLLSSDDMAGVEEIASFEEFERREMDQIDERMEKDPGIWEEIYRSARKSEKLRFEVNERDEGELQRTGRSICIYEVYDGAGTWPLLHHGSLYRGLSLSRRTRRLSSDDVDAVNRLPLLNDSHHRSLLCELGGMFSVAHKVDEIHKRPWIGFQSWRASGREVSLSAKAEKILEEAIHRQTKGDVIYFWTRLDLDGALREGLISFWSICDVLNGGHCRATFENTFRHMYGLPLEVEAIPPMPEDSGHWSTLHSWVMPTSSFLEFVMFTRMFVDSLDAVHSGAGGLTHCPLGLSEIEKKHCYCRLLELLVNVWAYHSARRMVYIDPHTGLLEEQHPIGQRKGHMWVKYFNFTLLKSMDEDLAEAADDGDLQRDSWLWPLTGEVHWQGIYEREREHRYRVKMDKKRKIKEKLFERMKFGYKQKSLGG